MADLRLATAAALIAGGCTPATQYDPYAPYRDAIGKLTRELEAERMRAADAESVAYIIALEIGRDDPATVETKLRSTADRTDGAERARYLQAADLVRRACGERMRHDAELAERTLRILRETRARQSARGQS